MAILPTASYADFKKWFDENRGTIKSLPTFIEVSKGGTSRKFQIRNQCLDPVRDYYTALGDKAAIALLGTAIVSSGRKPPVAGDKKNSKVGKDGKVVITASLLGVKEGDFVAVEYSNDAIMITKKPKD